MALLVLDTNLVGIDDPMGSNDARVLLDAARHGRLVLALPELVVREVMCKWRERKESQLAKLGSTARNLGELGSAIQVPETEQLEKLERRVEIALRERLTGPNLMVPGFPSVGHEEVVARALRREQPFDREGRDGYRDVLLWETVLELAAGEDVALLSHDLRAFADEEGEALSRRLASEAEERLGRPDAVELCSSLEAAVERFAPEDETVRERAGRLVRIDSFRRILEDRIEDGLESYYLRPAEVEELGIEARIPWASTIGLTRSLGRVRVQRAFEIAEGVGLVDVLAFSGVQISFYTGVSEARRLRSREDVWPAQGEWDELEAGAGDDAHLVTSRLVRLEVECAVALVPGTIERLRVIGLEAIDAGSFEEAEEPLDEEPGDVWPGEEGAPELAEPPS